jgi:hypothetical protein
MHLVDGMGVCKKESRLLGGVLCRIGLGAKKQGWLAKPVKISVALPGHSPQNLVRFVSMHMKMKCIHIQGKSRRASAASSLDIL